MTMYFTGGINGEWVDIPPTIEIFEPPDDRYLSGYKITDNVDGDVKIYGPRLKDLNVPFSLYGLPIPITFGVRRLTGNIIWARPLRESIKKKSKGGKGGPTTKSTEYKYYATFAVAFGIPGNTDTTSRDIIRMWAQNALVMDRRGYTASKWTGLDYTFYKGESDQPQDPTIVSYEGEELTPAYRDVMYVVFRDMPVEEFNNYIPSIGVEIGDTTSLEYIIRNVDTPDYNGTDQVSAGFADFSRGEYYTVVTGGELTAVTRAFNIASGTFISQAPINSEGVGWSNNNDTIGSSPAVLKETKGLSGNFNNNGYCPWLNLLWGKPNHLNTGEPFMLFDPVSGAVRYWIGTDIFSGIALDPKYPGISDPFEYLNGCIPQWDHAMCFRAYGDYVPTYFFAIATIYNDLVILKLDSILDRLDMVWYKAGIGDIRCMIEGELRPYESDFYFTKSGNKLVYRMNVRAAASRSGTGASSVVSGIEDPELVYTADANVYAMMYYAADNSLILFKYNGHMEKVSCEDYTQVWDIALPTSYTEVGPVYNMHLHNLEGGFFAYTVDGIAYEIDLTYGEITTWAEADNQFYAFSRYCDSRNSSITGVGGNSSSGTTASTTKSADDDITTLLFNRISDSRMPLADFILGMALYAGFLESEVDISADIDDEIDGAIISKLTSFKSVMRDICTAYRIEMFESAGVIKFSRRALGSGATTFDVTDDDLLISNPNNIVGDEPTLQIRREEELVVPQEVSLRYIDKSLGYQWNMASARRSQFISTNGSDEQLSLELPIIMTASEAKEICTRILWQAWNSRVAYSFRVDKEFVKIEPGDFGTLTSAGLQYNIRVAQVTYNTDYTLNIQGVNSISDEALTIVADAGGGDIPDPAGPSASDIFVFDIPLLFPDHDQSYAGVRMPYYVYVGPISYEMAWAGGNGYSSKDGTVFDQIATNVDTGLVMVATDIPKFDEGTWMTWDNEASITVWPKQGDVDLLENASQSEVLEGANLAAWGVNGRWELIAYTTVTNNGDGSYTLRGLLRGLRGTDFQMDSHKKGDYVVLMSVALTDVVYMALADIDKTLLFNAVGFGLDLTTGTVRNITMHGYGALPLPPHGLKMVRSIDDGTGDITITWDRRGRLMEPMVSNDANADLTDYETNDYKITIWRHPYYDTWAFSGGQWNGSNTGVDDEYVEIEVTGATTYNLTASAIRAAQLYEFDAPDNLYSSGSTFSQHGGAYMISENADANEIIPDLGYNEFVAFATLDVMIQQKTTIGNETGYGPGRRMTIVIKDL